VPVNVYSLINLAASTLVFVVVADPGPLLSRRTVAVAVCLLVCNLSGYFEGYAKASH
jgi:hypothetical protein